MVDGFTLIRIKHEDLVAMFPAKLDRAVKLVV